MIGTKSKVDLNESLDMMLGPPPPPKTCGWELHAKQEKDKRLGKRGARLVSQRAYRHGGLRPRGLHDYHNLMWDPSVYRGRGFKDFREKNFPPYTTTVNFNKYCCTEKCGVPEPPPRKQKKLLFSKFKVGGIIRPTTDDIMDEETGHRQHKQDEFRREIEPFVIEQAFPPLYKQMGTQADETKPKVPRRCATVAAGKSVATYSNICVCGTGVKEDPFKPVIDTMGLKILEQSLLECTEEFELQRIRAETSKYVERRRIRERKQMKLVERELFRAELDLRERYRRERELREELEASQGIEHLREIGFLENADDVVERQFEAVLDRQIGVDVFVPRMLLNDIIQNVDEKKLLDYAEQKANKIKEQIELEDTQAKLDALLLSEGEAPPSSANMLSSEGEAEEDI